MFGLCGTVVAGLVPGLDPATPFKEGPAVPHARGRRGKPGDDGVWIRVDAGALSRCGGEVDRRSPGRTTSAPIVPQGAFLSTSPATWKSGVFEYSGPESARASRSP